MTRTQSKRIARMAKKRNANTKAQANRAAMASKIAAHLGIKS